MANAYNKTAAILRPNLVQWVWPKSKQVDFVFADTPFVHWHADGRVGVLEDVALGDAAQRFFPVGPRLAAFFTSSPFPDVAINDDQVQLLNRRSWRAAMRFVGASPKTNGKRSLAMYDLTFDA
jgi:hypothetical protein